MNEYSTPHPGLPCSRLFRCAEHRASPGPCEEAARRFPLKMGRVHERPVGPHPDWSCQLAFAPEVFGELVPWLAIHRQDLVVFIHPVTGNDLLDHRDRAIWMGAIRPLDLSILDEGPQRYDFAVP